MCECVNVSVSGCGVRPWPVAWPVVSLGGFTVVLLLRPALGARPGARSSAGARARGSFGFGSRPRGAESEEGGGWLSPCHVTCSMRRGRPRGPSCFQLAISCLSLSRHGHNGHSSEQR